MCLLGSKFASQEAKLPPSGGKFASRHPLKEANLLPRRQICLLGGKFASLRRQICLPTPLEGGKFASSEANLLPRRQICFLQEAILLPDPP